MTDANVDTWQLSDTEVFSKYGGVFVPRRAAQMRAVVDLLAEIPEGDVLDLCCGEGRLSELYLRRHPERRVTVLDRSQEMLALTEKRLADLGGRHSSVQADIKDRSWRTGVSYAGVMTSLAVHHLDGPEKQQLYRDLHAMLAPGGAYVMADLVEPAGSRSRALAADGWDEAVKRGSQEQFGGDEAARAFAATEWNYYRLAGPDPVDQPSTVAEHLDWLRAAGFEQVDVAWIYAGHAVFTATKAARSATGVRPQRRPAAPHDPGQPRQRHHG